MKLPGMLLKAGVATAGAGIYLFFRRFFKKVKKTTNDTAEKIETKLEKPVKKKSVKPRTIKAQEEKLMHQSMKVE